MLNPAPIKASVKSSTNEGSFSIIRIRSAVLDLLSTSFPQLLVVTKLFVIIEVEVTCVKPRYRKLSSLLCVNEGMLWQKKGYEREKGHRRVGKSTS